MSVHVPKYARQRTRGLCDMRCEDCCSWAFTDCLDDFADAHLDDWKIEEFNLNVALLVHLNVSRSLLRLHLRSGAENGSFSGTLDRRYPIL